MMKTTATATLVFYLLGSWRCCAELAVHKDDSSGQIDKLGKRKRSSLRKMTESANPRTRLSRVFVEYTSQEARDHIATLSERVFKSVSTDDYLVVSLNKTLVPKLLQRDDITSIESDYLFYEQGFKDNEVNADDPSTRMLFQKTPYGISMVQADQVDVGKSPVGVCIADTGALAVHPDLPRDIMAGSSRKGSIDGSFLSWNVDRRGHGTHVAGTISASDNGFGVRGIGNIPLYITRALDDNGAARESDILQAIQQCVNSGAKVISLSLGGGGMSTQLSTLLTSLYNEKGYLIFGASGNNGQNAKMYPAAHPLVIAVGAAMEDRTIWPGSNYGSWLELSAPGKLVYSTAVDSSGRSTYAFYSGTSMATPHAAGVAALVWSHFPECTNTQIRYALAKSARDLGSSGCDDYFGYGVVQAKSAVDWLKANPCQSATYGKGTIDGGCSMLNQLTK